MILIRDFSIFRRILFQWKIGSKYKYDMKYQRFCKIPKIHNMDIRIWGSDVSLSIILTSMFQFYVTMRTFFNHNRYCKLLKGILEKIFYRQLETLWILSAFNTYDYHIRFVLNTFKIISISFVLYGYILLMPFFYVLNLENRKREINKDYHYPSVTSK